MATSDKNIVSQPPLMVPISDKNGILSKAWSVWFRDLYRRTSFKGGNAIDDNKNEIDESIIDIDATLEEVIEQVLVNIENIAINADGIGDNETAIGDHIALESAHGSNGDIVGFDDLATESVAGLVGRMAALSDAIESTSTVVVADASAAPVAYTQTHLQELVDLSNANKAAINSLVTEFNAAVIVLNTLIASSKSSGQMSS